MQGCCRWTAVTGLLHETFWRKCAYSYLQECLTANISQTTANIDVKPAPQCVSHSRDAETCKKWKSENFAVTGFLHPTDELSCHWKSTICIFNHIFCKLVSILIIFCKRLPNHSLMWQHSFPFLNCVKKLRCDTYGNNTKFRPNIAAFEQLVSETVEC